MRPSILCASCLSKFSPLTCPCLIGPLSPFVTKPTFTSRDHYHITFPDPLSVKNLIDLGSSIPRVEALCSVSICSTSASSSFWSLLSFCPLTTFLSSDMCDADFECWDSLLLYCWPSFSAFSLVSSPLSFR